MAWKDLSIQQKAEVMKLFTYGGILIQSPKEIGNFYDNALSSGGKIHIKPENRGKFTALKERTGHSASWFKAHGTPAQKKMATFAINARKWKHDDGGYKTSLTPKEEEQFQKWYDEYATARPMSDVSKNPNDVEHYYDYRGYWKDNRYNLLPPDRHFPDTYKLPGHPTFSDESKYADETAGHWDEFDRYIPANKFEGGGLKGILDRLFGKKEDSALEKPRISDEELGIILQNIEDALPDEYTHQSDSYRYGWKDYNLDERTDKYDKDRYYDVIEARYNGLSKAMDKLNFLQEEKQRLLPFLVTQNVLEGGWRVNKRKGENGGQNNFGGMRDLSVRSNYFKDFATPEDFYIEYLNNLDSKWGDSLLGKGKGWRNARSLADYARIINHEDLGLHTKKQWREYNKAHKPVYLYTPEWENNGTPLMDNAKFGGIQNRVNAYIEFMNMRNQQRLDSLRINNLTSDPRVIEKFNLNTR